MLRGVAQLGSATVLGTVGRWFESNRPDHPQRERTLIIRTSMLRAPSLPEVWLAVPGANCQCSALWSKTASWSPRPSFVSAKIWKKAVSRGGGANGMAMPALVSSIGDGISDLKTAQRLGCDFLGIGTGPKAYQLAALRRPLRLSYAGC